MAYDALAVANYFLDLASVEGEEVTPLKLQKLLFFAHGFYLGITNEILLKDSIIAWQYGPVIESVYHKFKEFGNNPITKPAIVLLQDENGDFKITVPSIEAGEEHERARKIIRRVWDAYGKFSGVQLSAMTHEENTPWDKITLSKSGKRFTGKTIPTQTIKNYFKKLIVENKARAM